MADEEAHGESIIPCDKRNLAPKVGPKFMMKARNLRPLVTAIRKSRLAASSQDC